MNVTFSPFLDTVRIARNVVDHTFVNGGGTFTRRGESVEPRNVWAVGGKEPGVQIPLPAQLDPETFGQVVQQVARFIQQTPHTDRGTYIGTWVKYGERLYLDVVDLIEDTASAIAVAAERGEEAIYNLGTEETYTLGQ